mmetsp:Transcript_109793/g.190028  ORF Transcript_109793/g.190028 Transcript_109793/m.190028 type:complete len:244 (+) Transcript_109793:162-893(+)
MLLEQMPQDSLSSDSLARVPHLVVHGFHLPGFWDHWIVTWRPACQSVNGHLRHNAFEMVLFYAKFLQCWNLQVCTEVSQTYGNGCCCKLIARGGVTKAKSTGNICITINCPWHGELGHCWSKHRIGESMRHMEIGTDAAAQAMDCRDRAVREGDARIHASQHHIRAGRMVLSILACSAKTLANACQRLQCICVGERIGLATYISFHGMAKRIDTCVGSEAKWLFQCKLIVHHCSDWKISHADA